MFKIFISHPKILIFCSLVSLFTCLGQTFLISWLNPHITSQYSISRTDLSIIYSGATFLSSFFLPFLGKKLDEMNILKFALITALFITLGFTVLSQVPYIWAVFLGFFIVRTFGQMTLGLISSTTIARKFGRHRGKALSLSQLGRTVGEAIFPGLLVFMIASYGWNKASLYLGFGFLFCFIPIAIYFLKDIDLAPVYEESTKIKKTNDTELFDKKIFYKDRPILLVLLANSLVPFVLTGLFFQQTSIAQMKNWDTSTMAMAFSIYAIIQVGCLLLSGPLVDRFTATRILPLSLIPMFFGMAVLKYGNGVFACYLYLALLGIATGLSASVRSSFYAENFSLHHLGAIKSIDSSYLVKATAFAPIIFSYCLDIGFTIDNIVLALWIFILIGIIMYAIASHIYFNRHESA